MMAGVAIYLGLIQFLWAYLKRNHAVVWASLGEPSFCNNSPRNGFRFVRWLLRRDYQRTGDKTVIRMGVVAEILFWIDAVLVVLFVIGIFTGAA